MLHRLKGKEILQDADIGSIFPINSRVQLNINGKHYPSRIEDVGPEHIIVAAPITQDTLAEIGTKHKVTVSVVFRNEMHEFNCEVSKKALGRIATIILTDLRHIGEVDRRQYARTMDPIPILYRMVRLVYPWEAISAWTHSIADDIGGGGIRVARKSDTRVSAGDMVEVKIILPTHKRINAICRVLRVCCTPGVGGPWGYWAAEFVRINKSDQIYITSFVEKRLAAMESVSK